MQIGRMHEYGISVNKDPNDALRWYSQASDRGLPEARVAKADMMLLSGGSNTDFHKAMKLYRQASDAGYPDGDYKLGLLYFRGKGIPQNFVAAARSFRNGAELGHDGCEFMLGKMYAEGKGVETDKSTARKYLSTPSSKGNAAAKEYLIDLTSKDNVIWDDGKQEEEEFIQLNTPDLLSRSRMKVSSVSDIKSEKKKGFFSRFRK